MFGDNESVVNNVSIPHAKLHKMHISLSFHRVMEVIAGDVMSYMFLPGKDNPADMLSKIDVINTCGRFYNQLYSGKVIP
jgi:hypothetical protein